MRAVVVNSALVVLMTTVESRYQYLSILRSSPPIDKTKATADTAEARTQRFIRVSLGPQWEGHTKRVENERFR